MPMYKIALEGLFLIKQRRDMGHLMTIYRLLTYLVNRTLY